MSDVELKQAARQVGLQMKQRGLRDELLIRAFTIVRECAQRTLGMRHYDVQIMGGWALVRGMIAEMQTGEGKTLTATLPACAAALAGIPVHVITVNDYLVERDASAMGPLYDYLGLSVGTILEGMQPDERRSQYACDVTYCTNKQVAFDYLKDRALLGRDRSRSRLELEALYAESPRSARLLLRGLCFAIVDEADSVMIDEAQTPLILSAPGDEPMDAQVYTDALSLAADFEQGRHFEIDPYHRLVDFLPTGLERVDEVTRGMGGPWLSAKFRTELIAKALSALHCFARDQHYLLADDRVVIIDEFTGRVMPDRTWEHGLHQMIEIKEGCETSAGRRTIARVSYQRFFRRYLRLAGMTGTASTSAREFWSLYGLKVASIPTNEPSRRRIGKARVFVDSAKRWEAVAARVGELSSEGRPVLVGTRTVATSEILSAALTAAGVEHVVLNARQDSEEARIVAKAGERGIVTVATNMAGRGTDIKLQPGVAELGGLHVLAAERNESARIDRQLIGRCGRQGDPGSAESMASIEDEVFVRYAPAHLLRLARRFASARSGVVPGWIARLMLFRLQRAAERRGLRLRKNLLDMDEHLDNVLGFSGLSE